ncbi:MAG: helix-turn-helix domain-containing protein [Vicinamibacterales bacterium]
MSNEAPKDFGAYLKEARLSRGVSLRAIADRTKISLQTLEALERNDVRRLPGGIFTRAFVRAYANEVGLDPERAVRLFVERFERQADGAGTGGHRVKEERVEESPAGRRAKSLALAGLALTAIAFAAWFLLLRLPAGTPSEIGPLPAVVTSPATPEAESTTGGAAAALKPRDVSPPASAAVGETAEPVHGLALGLTATRNCWVSATIDGSRTYQRLLRADDHVEIDADQTIVLRVGDAGAVTYTLNGEPGRPLGPPGAVVTERLTRENYKEYVKPRE